VGGVKVDPKPLNVSNSRLGFEVALVRNIIENHLEVDEKTTVYYMLWTSRLN
jgi:hypothetical protein